MRPRGVFANSLTSAILEFQWSDSGSGRKPTFLLESGMNRTGIVAKIEEIANRVAQPEGIEIVEIDLKGAGRHQVLLIVIDKLTGVTHGDCEFISQQVGTILDVEDVIHG